MEEIWKTIEGYEKYQVSNLGNVRSLELGRHLTQTILNTGYPAVTIKSIDGKRKLQTVHRLVAEMFIPNPDNLPVVNHIDNNRSNAHVDNLEWVSLSKIQRKKENTKPVYQKDMEGNIIKIWDSAVQAVRESNRFFRPSGIHSVASGRKKHYRNFIWEFVDAGSTKGKSMKINMYNVDGVLLYNNLNMTEVMRKLGMNNPKTLRDKLRNSEVGAMIKYKDYYFQFAE